MYSCVEISTGRSFAVKRIPMSTRSERITADRELNILSELVHPSINRLHDHFVDRLQCLLVLERLHGETLGARLKREGAVPESIAAGIFAQVVSAVQYLHSRGVVHRDLHPGNIMLEAGGYQLPGEGDCSDVKVPRTVLLDLGLARALRRSEIEMAKAKAEKKDDARLDTSFRSKTERLTMDLSSVGVRGYAAPEILRRMRSVKGDERARLAAPCTSEYGMAVDSYSLGMVLRCMLTGCPPNTAVFEYINKNTSPFTCVFSIIGKFLPPRSTKSGAPKAQPPRRVFREANECSPEAQALLKNMLHVDVDKRLPIHAVARHPWLVAAGEAAACASSCRV